MVMTFKKLHYLEKFHLFTTDFAIDKNIRTTLKAVKEDTSAPGPSNAVINEKTSIPIANKDISVQAVLSAPTPFTSCTSALIKAPKKYQDKVDRTEALKKKRTRRQQMSKNKYSILLVVEPITLAPPASCVL
ncbi:hypothetical protein RMCBS344292_01617 [Rhizopus microsporus]|nr:hypothetical protein RMCBS344292_01617 [Rhizopus microsporus]